MEDKDGDGPSDQTARLRLLPGDGDAGARRMAVSPDGKGLVIGCGPGTTLSESLRSRRGPTQSGALCGFICRMNPDGSEPERDCAGGDQPARLIHCVSGGDYAATVPRCHRVIFPTSCPACSMWGRGTAREC